MSDGPAKFRKKPVEVEAMQLGLLNIDEAETFIGGDAGTCPEHRACLVIATLEGAMHASMGDWVIRGVAGEFYPCKPDIFAATYEPAGVPVPQPQDEPQAVPCGQRWDSPSETPHECARADGHVGGCICGDCGAARGVLDQPDEPQTLREQIEELLLFHERGQITDMTFAKFVREVVAGPVSATQPDNERPTIQDDVRAAARIVRCGQFGYEPNLPRLPAQAEPPAADVMRDRQLMQIRAAVVKCCDAGRVAYPDPCPWHGGPAGLVAPTKENE